MSDNAEDRAAATGKWVIKVRIGVPAGFPFVEKSGSRISTMSYICLFSGLLTAKL